MPTTLIPIKQLTSDATINVALDTIERNKQALVFVNTKRSAEKCAEDIAKQIKLSSHQLVELSEQILNVLPKPTEQCQRLAKCVKKGIAFHHAGLVADQRGFIEDNFRAGVIKIITCTPTLALGVNLPAFRSVIRDVKRYTRRGMEPIPVLEYLQMAGRAGRPGKEKYGEAICIASSEAEKEALYERYVLGEPEEIYSKLAVEPVLRTYLLSLIAGNFVRSKTSIMDFFSKTFWAYQFEDMPMLEKIIDKMLDLLEEYDFISKDDFVDAIEAHDVKYTATSVGRRVAELYLDPLTAFHLITGLKRAASKLTTVFSYVQLIAYTLELRPLLRVRVKEYADIQTKLNEHESELIMLEPSMFEPDYEDFMDSVKTALFFMDWMEETDEQTLLDKYDIRPGEIRSKLDMADWLLYSASELAKLLQFHQQLKDVLKVRFRVMYGAKEELLPLLKLQGIGRVRARKLYSNGIKDLGDIKKADLMTLAQLIGKHIAVDLKKQVGENVEKIVVKEGKRKGQISLKDY